MILGKLIADMYQVAIEVVLWIVLILGGLLGYGYWGDAFGAIVGIIGGFFVDLVVFGTLLVLLDIRAGVKKLGQELVKE